MRGAPPPPVIRPPNAAADHQLVGAQLYSAVEIGSTLAKGAKIITVADGINTKTEKLIMQVL